MACPNSVVASGIIVPAGGEVRIAAVDPGNCSNPLGAGSGTTVVGSDGGTVFSIVSDASISGFHVKWVAPGSAILTITRPGYSPPTLVNATAAAPSVQLDVVQLP